MREQTVHSAEFRREHEPHWLRLEDLLKRMGKRGAPLTPEEIGELPQLYRTTLSSLSVARNYVLDQRLTAYLEALALRGYTAVYGPREGLGALARRAAARDFPITVRQAWVEVLMATLALLVGILAGWAMTAADPENFYAIVPGGLSGGRGPYASAAEMADSLRGQPITWESGQVFAAFLAGNNAAIALLAAALGLLLGVPTLLLLLYNGAMIGAMIAAFDVHGLATPFVAWLAVHGVTELGAIVLSGAAGLTIARGVLFPRPEETRLDAARRAGWRAGLMAAGAFVMLFIAAFLEAVMRQTIEPTMLRYAFGLATAVIWGLYFVRAGRGR